MWMPATTRTSDPTQKAIWIKVGVIIESKRAEVRTNNLRSLSGILRTLLDPCHIHCFDVAVVIDQREECYQR